MAVCQGAPVFWTPHVSFLWVQPIPPSFLPPLHFLLGQKACWEAAIVSRRARACVRACALKRAGLLVLAINFRQLVVELPNMGQVCRRATETLCSNLPEFSRAPCVPALGRVARTWEPFLDICTCARGVCVHYTWRSVPSGCSRVLMHDFHPRVA